MSAQRKRGTRKKSSANVSRDSRSSRAPAGTSARGTGSRTGVIAVCVVALAASILGIANAFTQDDVSIIVESTRLHGFGELRDILTLPYWPPPAAPDLYRPLASLLMAAQYALGAGGPLLFRLVSYVLYAAASVAVYQLARRLMPDFVAIGVAALFAAHPLHVEAVALAVTQNELIVGALAAVMVARYLDRRRSSVGALSWGDCGFLAACYIVAGFAKEQGLLLPAFLVLAELILVPGRAFSTRVRDTRLGFALLGVLAAAMVTARTAVLSGVVGPTMIAEALRGQSLGGRMLTMLQIVPQWARLLVWPAHLRAEYSPKELVASTAFGGTEALGLAILLIAASGIWLGRRRAPPLSFGLAWCLLGLFPVSNVLIPTGILLAERTLFLPSIGFVIAVGGAVTYVSATWATFAARARTAAAVAMIALVILAIARSAERQRVWHDSATLTLASIDDAPRSWRVQQAYGDMLFRERRPAEAIAAFRRSIDLAPSPWQPRNYLAAQLRLIGDDSDAVMLLRVSQQEDPRQIQTVAALGPALIGAGRYLEAKQLADSVIAAEQAPPMMVQLSRIADSAMKANAPPGSIRIGVPRP